MSCEDRAIKKVFQKSKWNWRVIHLIPNICINLNNDNKLIEKYRKEYPELNIPRSYTQLQFKPYFLLKIGLFGRRIAIHTETAHEHHKFCAPDEDQR